MHHDVCVSATLGPPQERKAAIPTSAWWVLVAVALGSFMAGLDGSNTNTVLPVIGREDQFRLVVGVEQADHRQRHQAATIYQACSLVPSN